MSSIKFQVVGVSCVDALASTISVCEFKDDENLTDLESLVVTLAPKECLVVQSSSESNNEFQNLKQVILLFFILKQLIQTNFFKNFMLFQYNIVS